ADPHSSRRGFWWSHMGWLLRPQASLFDIEYHGQYAPELVRDRYYRWLGRNFLVLQVVLAALLYSLGGWPFVVYGIFVRAVLLWHATWCVNSATHYWGYRNFNIADDARNLWWVSLITYGEGWHNNHHRFPRAAQTGWRWWELDVTWATIRLLQQFGLAQKVRTIPVDKADLRTQANLNGNSRKI
ncbi:MAG: fatty acid desaturase, partial [Cyanobacteria bacterium P01_A01_bin.135]